MPAVSPTEYLHRVASEAELARFGLRLAHALPAVGLVALVGDLGVGKTTLVRHVLRALGHRGAVRSPTFTLLEYYELASRTVCHLDLYRLTEPEELEYLGVRDYVGRALLMVEWPERVGAALPTADLTITLSFAVSAGSAHDAEPDASRNLSPDFQDQIGATAVVHDSPRTIAIAAHTVAGANSLALLQSLDPRGAAP